MGSINKAMQDLFASVVLLNDTSVECHHGCTAVVEGIFRAAEKAKLKIVYTHPGDSDLFGNGQLMDAIRSADGVLINGEGTLHDAQPRAIDLMRYAQYIKVTFGKPIVLLNATYQDNGDEFAKLMQYLDLVYVRESYSQNELQKYGISSKAVPDMSFYVVFDICSKSISESSGVTDSVDPAQSEELLKLSLERGYTYLPILAYPKIEKGNLRSVATWAKFRLMEKMHWLLIGLTRAQKHKIEKRAYYSKDYGDYIRNIAYLKFLVTARYHTLCFALKTLTPFVAIEARSFRMRGLLDDIGIGRTRIIKSHAESLTYNNFSIDEQLKIREFVDLAPAKIDQMFLDIRNYLQGYTGKD